MDLLNIIERLIGIKFNQVPSIFRICSLFVYITINSKVMGRAVDFLLLEKFAHCNASVR